MAEEKIPGAVLLKLIKYSLFLEILMIQVSSSKQLKVMKRAALYKHRQAVKTTQFEEKLFNSQLHSF